MDNLPQKENIFLSKIKRYLFNIFKKKESKNNKQDNNVLLNNDFDLSTVKEGFLDKLQKDIKKQKIEDSIIDSIEKNPKIITSLSTEKIRMATQIYNKKIEEINNKIKALKQSAE